MNHPYRPSRSSIFCTAGLLVAGCLAVLPVSCATSHPSAPGAERKDPSKGFQTLDATVVGKDFEPAGTGGSRLGGEGTYYLLFEAREGEANASYRFPVTRAQYQRYSEGSRVQIVIADHELRDLRPGR